MVMPLHDDAGMRRLRFAAVNWLIIALNILVFVVVYSEIYGDPLTVVRGFAIIPAVLFGEAELASWVIGPPAPATLVTSLFFHSSFLHLAGNILFLYVFGDNVEDAMGSLHYLLFYMSCGVASGVFFIYSAPHALSLLVGASGAISGVCAAFLLLYPHARIFGLVMGIFPIHAPAWAFVGTWIALQFLNALFAEGGHTAWTAHVGGIAAGLLLTPLFKSRGVRLFEAPRPRPPRVGEPDAPLGEGEGEAQADPADLTRRAEDDQ